MKYSIYLVLLSLLLLACSGTVKKKSLTGNYLGENPPSESAYIFAPGIISTEFNVRDFAISPQGDEIFFTLRAVTGMKIITLKQIDGVWSDPSIASFSSDFDDLEPCFSPDGSELFFVSNRPLQDGSEPKDYDIWITKKENDRWSRPENIGAPVSTDANEFYPSVTNTGRVYFCMKNDKTIGGEDIFYTDIIEGKYSEPENAGENINTKSDEYNAFVARDENYIIYNSHGWGPGTGSGDMWISFKNDSGEFQKPVNLGSRVNTKYFEYCPFVTPDEKYLFFTSNIVPEIDKSNMSYTEIMNLMHTPQNGTSNIYWISADIITDLRTSID